MFKSKIALLSLVATLMVLSSCGGPAIVDIKLDKFGLSMSGPEPKKAPEYKEMSSDKLIGRYTLYIGEKRISVEEMEASIYPENLKMITDIISTSEGFEALLKGDKYPNGAVEFPNGAFGVVYSKKNSKGKSIKDYVFYLKKGERYFRVVPVLNSELDGLDQQLAAVESMK